MKSDSLTLPRTILQKTKQYPFNHLIVFNYSLGDLAVGDLGDGNGDGSGVQMFQSDHVPLQRFI